MCRRKRGERQRESLPEKKKKRVKELLGERRKEARESFLRSSYR